MYKKCLSICGKRGEEHVCKTLKNEQALYDVSRTVDCHLQIGSRLSFVQLQDLVSIWFPFALH